MSQEDRGRLTALETAIHQFGEAWARGDLAALDALLSPNYIHNDATGARLPHDDWLAYAVKRRGRATGISFRDQQTRLYGDVAIVTGVNELSGPGILNPDDQAPLSIRFLQVWIWRDGRWLREAFQATPILPDRVYS